MEMSASETDLPPPASQALQGWPGTPPSFAEIPLHPFVPSKVQFYPSTPRRPPACGL